MFRRRKLIFISLLLVFTILALLLYGPRIIHEKFDITKLAYHEDQVIIEPNNVQFNFQYPSELNREQIIELNKQKYQNLFQEKISHPKDCKLVSSTPGKANATILALVRNNEVVKIGQTIRSFQKKFNNKFKYPYTFLNDEPFTDHFKSKIRKYIGDEDIAVEFVTIPGELWNKPDWIDNERESQAMDYLFRMNVAYSRKTSYHNMCRFYSGQFYNVPELAKYKYYWRIEPNVEIFTDINYDVFQYMEDSNKIYGFTISLYDIELSVETLWQETLNFLNQDNNYKYLHQNGSFKWLLDPLQNPKKSKIAGGYSTCHFWSNFEIGNMDFFRGEAYNNWFKYLDSTGKFYYERWGDAPIHSIGVSLFAGNDQIHWFRDVGYFHDPYYNCPNNEFTTGCKVGKFSVWEHLWDQNCIINWVDYHGTESYN
ncbi:putative mannosyltransferase KTR4 [Spathaspora sp. JA1]|nr:putative mannosyltransferase KTR4 [Spathaspora sp. JA1]